MIRIDPYAAAAAPLPVPYPECVPGIATVSALGLDAVVHINDAYPLRSRDLFVSYVAAVADGRLRSGVLHLRNDRKDIPREGTGGCIPAFLMPDGPDDMARAITRAVDIVDAAGKDHLIWSEYPPFTLGGWHPYLPGTRDADGPVDEHLKGRTLPWLGSAPFDGKAAEAAWSRSVARRIGPEAIEAMCLFAVAGHIDPAAFDAACDLGPSGKARRAFAKANPLLANLALGHPASLDLVDSGAPLREVLAAIPGTGVLGFGKKRLGLASRRALANLSGTPFDHRQTDGLATVVGAADALPREWMPRTRDETDAFTRVCLGAEAALSSPPRGPEAGDWWRRALAGAGGRWVDYENRILDAACPTVEHEERNLLPHVLEIQAEARKHFVNDVAIPVVLAHGAGNVLALARLGARIRPGGSYARSYFEEFVLDALTAGMALPAVGDMGRRHEEALHAIKAVVDAAPLPGPAPATMIKPKGAFDLCTMPDGRRVYSTRCEAGRLTMLSETAGALIFEPESELRTWSVNYFVAWHDGGTPPDGRDTMEAVLRRWGTPQALLDAITGGKGLPALGRHPITHGRHTPYDASGPGTLDAMLAAWRPVMPRRWRPLDAAGLAAALDDEAAAFSLSLTGRVTAD